MPDLDTFELFQAVARTGSVSAAARELGMTQQAVSRRLRSMEALVGVALAERTAAGAQLTPAGTVVADWSSRLLDVAGEVDRGLESLRGESCEQIAVTASPTVTECLMPHWLMSFQHSYARSATPAPRVVLTASNSPQVVAAVRDGAADLGFIENPSPPIGLGHRVVGRDELAVVVAPSHPWARGSRTVAAEQLANTPLISRESGSGIRDSLTEALKSALGAGVEHAPPQLELPSTAAIRAAVLTGAGPAVMSRLTVGDDLAVGRLCEVNVSQLDLRRQFRAVWRGGRTPPAGVVRRMLTHIRCHPVTLTT